MTTLLDERDAFVIRCDDCRRLWPVTRERLEAEWECDDARDLHRCPVCVDPRPRHPAWAALASAPSR